MIRGDFSEAMRWLRRMLRDGSAASGAKRPTPQEPVAHINLARCLLYRGELDACEGHVNAALELCHLFNLTAQRAEAYQAYGDLYRERGDAARAAEFYKHAEQAYEAAGIDITRFELLEEKALLHLQTGDYGAAHALLPSDHGAARGRERGVMTARLARRASCSRGAEHEPGRYERPRTLPRHASTTTRRKPRRPRRLLRGRARGRDDEHLRRTLEWPRATTTNTGSAAR